MLSRVFLVHGRLCASHPWEVIFGTTTLIACLTSMSFFTFSERVCGWNYKCTTTENDVKSSDVMVLGLTRCLAVIYLYMQFRNLRRIGSKYLLGIAALFTLFSSFMFAIAVINLLGGQFTGLHEALPFFLLIVDLSKACALAKFALSSKNQEEIRENIGQGMAILGPTITLDTLVETLVISVGTLSGVKSLETMSCFGCLSVVANYLAFMTFYPACLALIFELTRNRGPSNPVYRLQYKISKVLQDLEDEKPNPVTQKVKCIMTGGLFFVHAHGRLITGSQELQTEVGEAGHMLSPDVPLWQFYYSMMFPLSLDYVLSLILSTLLFIKYILYDSSLDTEIPLVHSNSTISNMAIAQNGVESSNGAVPCKEEKEKFFDINRDALAENKKIRKEWSKERMFIIGDSSDEDDQKVSVATQTCLPSKNDNHCNGSALPGIKVEMMKNGSMTSCSGSVPACSADQDGSKLKQKHSRSEDASSSNCTRSLKQCLEIFNSDKGAVDLTDDEVRLLVKQRHIPAYKLEANLQDHERGVKVRRQLIAEVLQERTSLALLPYAGYDYTYVEGSCCENVIGYMPVPVGVAGPLSLDGKEYHIPMATTEGCLVASTNRGCRALKASGGVASVVVGDGMTRAPVVRFPTAQSAGRCKAWLEDADNFELIADYFNSTSRFARLKRLHVVQAARMLYIRFVSCTGDAMGMNMISKGAEKALSEMNEKHFSDMEILSLSGNLCTDKKPAAINWVEGRGKSVICEAVVPAAVVKTTLKTSVPALVELNINKNLIGSAMAGSVGGFNAHAANIVTAIFIATGQDPAQNISSSNCMTIMEARGDDLYISCTMPSIELGTIGGGTVLPPQAACLQMLGVKGPNCEQPGLNATTLARIVCAAVLAGELSLMSALAAGHLVRSHLRHNRSALNMAAASQSSQDPPCDGTKNTTTVMDPSSACVTKLTS